MVFQKIKTLKASLYQTDLIGKNTELKNNDSNKMTGNAVKLHTIREGNSPAVFVINGFLSGKGNDVSDWLEVVDELYPLNKVIHVQWRAGNISDLVFDEGLIKAAPSINNQNSMLKKLGAVSLVAANKVSGHWRKAFTETAIVGTELAAMLDVEKGYDGCILMGHSLGARIIHHTLDKLPANKVSQCYLLAGAVSSGSKLWNTIFELHPHTQFINCMSKTDSVLKYAYKVGTLLRETPIGLHPLGHKSHPLIINQDVTEVAQKHTKFKHKALGLLLQNIVRAK
ncbi:DUF726 domain-containing protein [Photobacterium indicum]|uniref:DUF726 domain-containing protein n=1 Tax=Photobacterium indicum TaxID=81447 RepID=A0A2T3LEM1_9GAMM|nr:DUF726 domain-containing protein [Photobacterium indicum]PSV49831.1 hypothetical protein C9J47_04565 [Photobacterium indicum]